MQCQLIRIAWALIVLKEWEHPLLRQVLSCLSAAPPPLAPLSRAQARSSNGDEAVGAANSESHDVPTEVVDQQQPSGEGPPVPEEEANAIASPARAAVGDAGGNARVEAFRGATGSDRRPPLEQLPQFALLQLAQCVLLASAAGEADLLALLPEHLRRSCGTAWRGAPTPPLPPLDRLTNLAVATTVQIDAPDS